jgi:DNA-nicking Smr family endonuclease
LIRGRKTRLPKKSAPARLDLHGHTVAAAEDLVNQFLRRARLAGARQVIIITGKGMHSDKPGGILKSSIARFLDAGKAGEIRGWRRGNPHEGGDGSIIVDL